MQGGQESSRSLAIGGAEQINGRGFGGNRQRQVCSEGTFPGKYHAGAEGALCRIQNLEGHSLKLLVPSRKDGKIHSLIAGPKRHTGRAHAVGCVSDIFYAQWNESALRSFYCSASQSNGQITAISIRNCLYPAQDVGPVGFVAMLESSMGEFTANHREHSAIAIFPDQPRNIHREIPLEGRIDAIKLSR